MSIAVIILFYVLTLHLGYVLCISYYAIHANLVLLYYGIRSIIDITH